MNPLKLLVLVSVVLLAGCGKKDESVAKSAGSKVGDAVTDFALGVGKSFDKKMTVKVELSPSLVELGVSTTIAKWIDTGAEHGEKKISVYFITTKPVSGMFIAKALTEENTEIGRATEQVEFSSDDAKYVQFRFGGDLDTQLVAKYVVDMKKTANQRPEANGG